MGKKLKGVRKLNKVVNAFAKQFGVKFHLGTQFEISNTTNDAWYAVVLSDNYTEYYRSSVKEISNENIPIFLMSFLHEIGHYVTKEFFTEDEMDDEWLMKDEIQEKYDGEACKEYAYEYFSLPMEQEATNWGVAYFKLHAKECMEFYNKFLTELYHFFKINHVEE